MTTHTNVIVLVSVSGRRQAQRIVMRLLEKRLIACANIYGPVESRFQWEGKIEKTKEFLVLMKSNRKLFDRLAQVTKELHGYEVPEILAVPIVDGFPPYLDWLNASLMNIGE